MRLRFVLLALGAASVWMVDRGLPERAGQPDTATAHWCPECDSELFIAGDSYVCNNRHRCRWDEVERKMVMQE